MISNTAKAKVKESKKIAAVFKGERNAQLHRSLNN